METRKKLGYFIGALVIIILSCILPTPEGLSRGGMIALGLLLAGIFMWITDVMPLAISGVLLMVLMPYLGVMPIGMVWTKFISSVIFFVIAAFALTTAMMKTTIPIRMIAMLLKWSGNNPNKVVLGFMICTALVSTIVTNTACCALFMGLALPMLKANNAVVGKSNLGKCLMIGIPVAAMIGGGATPVGVSINIMAAGMLENYMHIQIPFLDWVIMAAPMSIILIPISWLCIVSMFKMEKLTQESVDMIMEKTAKAGSLTLAEKKVVGILMFAIVFWVASSWVKAIDGTAVALLALVLMFVPGINVLKFDEFVRDVSWNVIILIGSVQSLAAGILFSGAAAWLVNSVMNVIEGAGNTVIMTGATILLAIMHLIIPVGPAIAGMTVIPFADVAALSGISPVAMTIMIAFNAAISFILAIDCVPLITLGLGYYKMSDMAKIGIIPTIVMTLYCIFVLPFLAKMLGY